MATKEQMETTMNKQNKAATEDRLYSPNQYNPYMDKLSTVGMRIRQNVDSKPTGCSNVNLNTNMYAALIVPQFNQQVLQQDPPMLSKHDSSVSDLEMMNASANNINNNGKRSF